MLLILFMANNLLIGQFTACQKTNYLFSKRTLIKTWPMALLGHPSLTLTSPFFLYLSLLEAYGYALTTGVSTTSILRTSVLSPWLTSL